MSDQATEYWYVERDGAFAGPLPRDEVEALLASGELSETALVWRDGQQGWRQASAVFSAPKPNALPPSPLKHRARLALLTLLAVAATVLLVMPKGDLVDWIETGLRPTAAAAIVGVLVVAHAIAIHAWWRHAGRLAANGHAPLTPGMIKAGCVTVSLLLACFVAYGFATVRATEKLSAILADYERYTITYDAPSAVLRVSGTIGPQFAAKLSGALAAHPKVAALSLTSVGGLVGEAMEAARSIEARRLSVVVDEECNSACLILYAAGHRHVARWNAFFGFHAVAPVLADFGDAVPSTETLGEEADAYMVSRGIPRKYVDEANRLGPESLYAVAALDLAEQGFVNDIQDENGKKMPLDLVRWRTIEEALFEENWQLSEILRAIREAAPDEILKHARALHDAWLGEEAAAVSAAYRLVWDLRQDALQTAEARTIFEFAQARGKAIGAMALEGDWQGCAAFAADDTQTQAIRSPLRQDVAVAFGRLVKSASARGWVKTAIGPDAQSAYEGLKADADLAVMLTGTIDEGSDEARIACLRAKRLAEGITALEPAQAADTFRYADSFGGWTE